MEDLQKHMQLMKCLKKSNEFLKKLKEFLKKTQGILEKTQGTGGLRLAYPPKKCPNKKPALVILKILTENNIPTRYLNPMCSLFHDISKYATLEIVRWAVWKLPAS